MNKGLLKLLLLGTGAFNVNDYFLTGLVISKGHGEGNPVVNLLVKGPSFAVAKLVAVPCLLLGLWIYRDCIGQKMLFYAWLIFIAYGLLMLYFRIVFL